MPSERFELSILSEQVSKTCVYTSSTKRALIINKTDRIRTRISALQRTVPYQLGYGLNEGLLTITDSNP